MGICLLTLLQSRRHDMRPDGARYRKLSSDHLHAERLKAFLKTATGEILERMHIVTEVHSNLLPAAQGEAGHVAEAFLPGDLFESDLLAERIHHQLSVEGEGWKIEKFLRSKSSLEKKVPTSPLNQKFDSLPIASFSKIF